MRKRSLFAILGIAALSLLMVLSAGIAFADGPTGNENPADDWDDDTEIWADIGASLITRLEPCETFGIIPAGIVSSLLDNYAENYVDTRTVDGEPYPSADAGADVLADWGPGVEDGDKVLQQTERIDYNVSGNVAFETKAFILGDFTEAYAASTDTIDADRLAIEQLEWNDGTDSWDIAGFENFDGVDDDVLIIDEADPTDAGDAGLTFGFDLELDVPDDTDAGTYHTTLRFVTYQM